MCRTTAPRAVEPLEPRRLLADVGIARDTAFGDGGRALLDVAPRDLVNDSARLPDGKFVVVGAAGIASTNDAIWPAQGLVARFNADGSPDATFDTDGVITVPVGWDSGQLVLRAVVPLPDGKLLVGGHRARFEPGMPDIQRDLVFARYNADGSPDTTFGNGGVAFPVPQAELLDIVALPGGKFLAGGLRVPQGASLGDAALWRFNPDGSLDPTFGDGGQVLYGGDLHSVETLLPRPDGTVVGTINNNLVTFAADGSLLRPLTDLANPIYPRTLTALPDGKLLFARPRGDGFSFARLLPDGVTPDPTFNPDIVHTFGTGWARPKGVAVMPDGRILVGVVVGTGVSLTEYGTVIRLLPDGRRDPELPAPAAYPTDPWADEGVVRPFLTGDGGLTVVGMAKTSEAPAPHGSYDLMLARYELDPPLTVDAGGPYVVDEGTPFGVSASASYAGGEIVGYDWDTNYDGVTFTADATGPAATLKFMDDRPAPRAALRVTTSDGLVALAPVDVTVRNVAPEILRLDLTANLVFKGNNVSLTSTFSDPGADQWTASVQFSDDNSTVNLAPAQHAFTASHQFRRGTHTVTATVRDDEGGSDTATTTVTAVDIVGTVYKDTNDDGRFVAPDRPWPGVEVYLDRDDDGVADPAEERSVTDAAGRYSFTNLANGTYVVRLVSTPAGWRYSAPSSGRAQAVVTSTTGARADFGLTQQSRITGTVFNDINHSGTRDAGENPVTGLGAMPYVDLDDDGRWDPHEPIASAVAEPGGKYVIQNLAPGTYTVRFTMEQPATWTVTGPAARTGYAVTVGPAEVKGDYDFARALTSAFLRGTVFEDVDGDGVRDSGEGGSAGWVVYADADADGILDPDEQRVESSEQQLGGAWSMGVEPGSYVLRLQPRDGRTQTAPSPTGAAGGAIRVSVVTSEQKSNLNFGYRQTGQPAVVGAHLFYDNSAYDAVDPSFHSEANDAAIAPGKAPLQPGQAGGFANVSGYSRGLNGVIIDLMSVLPQSPPLNTDFLFRFSRGGPSPTWTAAPTPRWGLRPGDGAGGTERVELTFPDNAMRDGWVEVTVAANIRTGLPAPRKFYFGHLTGNVVGGGASELAVDSRDLVAVRRRAATFGDAVITKTGVIDPMDVNADGLVDQADVLIVRANLGHRLAPLSAPAAVAATSSRIARLSPPRRTNPLLA
jgi:uncharacterized delta-60 repeat protein